MIVYAPAKINIGLRIIDKRADGFHNLDSYLYPLPLQDILEVNESREDSFEQSGIISTANAEDNLVIKALQLMRKDYDIPPLAVHLHKQIPVQAGLGGGSSNAVSMLKYLKTRYASAMSEADMLNKALALGSDCPFFLQKKAARIGGRGEFVASVDVSLAGKYIVLVKPPVAISTGAAFAQARLSKAEALPDITQVPLADWQPAFPNEFEQYLGVHTNLILDIKQALIDKGAFYAALSGSGSTVFGLFHHETAFDCPQGYFCKQLTMG